MGAAGRRELAAAVTAGGRSRRRGLAAGSRDWLPGGPACAARSWRRGRMGAAGRRRPAAAAAGCAGAGAGGRVSAAGAQAQQEEDRAGARERAGGRR